MSYTDSEFFEKLKPYVIEDMNKSNILASLTAAQAKLESRSGNSDLTRKANNLFGIKGNYNGASVNMLTTEVINGNKVKVYADFRKYPSWLESISDHSAFLLKYKRYASIIGEKDYNQACLKMAKSGYATANWNEYYNSLISIIKKNKLYEWDKAGNTTNYKTPESVITYNIGQTYTLASNLYIRAAANGAKVELEDITDNARKNAYEDASGYAILKKGTRVTCKDVKELSTSTWIKIPSGWICAKNAATVFVN